MKGELKNSEKALLEAVEGDLRARVKRACTAATTAGTEANSTFCLWRADLYVYNKDTFVHKHQDRKMHLNKQRKSTCTPGRTN